MYIRHHSLFAPRDFDISPYFQVIKVGLDVNFDYRTLPWAEPDIPQEPIDVARTDHNVLNPVDL